jgi:hypothetical protein
MTDDQCNQPSPNPERLNDPARCYLPLGHNGWHQAVLMEVDEAESRDMDTIVFVIHGVEEWRPGADPNNLRITRRPMPNNR